MKGFQFNLKKVLEVRSLEEGLAQDRLSLAQQKARKIEEHLEKLKEGQFDLYNYLREERNLSLEEIIQGRNFLYLQRQKINNEEKQLETQNKVVDQRRKEFLEKRKEREALEKLEEKEFNRYTNEILKYEQKELDEIGRRLKGLQGV